MSRKMSVYIYPSDTKPSCYDVKIYSEGDMWYHDWHFPSLYLAKAYGVNMAKRAGCDNPEIIVKNKEEKPSHKFCVKVRNDYFGDFIHRNSQGILELDQIGTEFASGELADVIVEVTKLINHNGWFSSEIIVQLL